MPRAPLSSPFFLVQITAKNGAGAATEYQYSEVFRTSGEFVVKTGGRYGSATNPGFALLGEFAVGDYALCRSADGEAGLVAELLPLPSTSGASDCSGCGWLKALQDLADCLTATVTSAAGRCDCEDTFAVLALSSLGDGVWSSAPNTWSICGTDFFVAFDRDERTLTLSTGESGGVAFSAEAECCGCNFAKFTFADLDLCVGETDAEAGPCGNLLEVKIEWQACGVEAIQTDCCEEPVPVHLCIELEAIDEDAACLDGTYALTYNPALGRWCTDQIEKCGLQHILKLQCIQSLEEPDPEWSVGGAGAALGSVSCTTNTGGPNLISLTLVSCDPFEITGVLEWTNDPLTGLTSNFTITVAPEGGCSGSSEVDCCPDEEVPDYGFIFALESTGDCGEAFFFSFDLVPDGAGQWKTPEASVGESDPGEGDGFTAFLNCTGGEWTAWIDTTPQNNGVLVNQWCPSEVIPNAQMIAIFDFTFAGTPCTGTARVYFVLDPTSGPP